MKVNKIGLIVFAGVVALGASGCSNNAAETPAAPPAVVANPSTEAPVAGDTDEADVKGAFTNYFTALGGMDISDEAMDGLEEAISHDLSPEGLDFLVGEGAEVTANPSVLFDNLSEADRNQLLQNVADLDPATNYTYFGGLTPVEQFMAHLNNIYIGVQFSMQTLTTEQMEEAVLGVTFSEDGTTAFVDTDNNGVLEFIHTATGWKFNPRSLFDAMPS